MSRPAATVVVVARDDVDELRTCLDALRPTLGPDDRLVVVDDASSDGTPILLAGHADLVRTVRSLEPVGVAAGRNAGAAQADTPVLVFLDPDTVVTAPWLDRLVAPLASPSVGAAGPLSCGASGAQFRPIPDAALISAEAALAYAQGAMATARRAVTRVPQLDGFALAVRADAFRSARGFADVPDEDVDLCRRVARAGRRLVVVEDSYVLHLVSAGAHPDLVRPDPALSIVLDCTADLETTTGTLVEVVDLCGDRDAELVLLDHGGPVAELIASQVSGGQVRVAPVDDGADAFAAGLALTNNDVRVLVRAGELVDRRLLGLVLERREGPVTQRVGVPA